MARPSFQGLAPCVKDAGRRLAARACFVGMPELPEVEHARGVLERVAVGRRVRSVACADDPIVLPDGPREVERALKDRTIVAPAREMALARARPAAPRAPTPRDDREHPPARRRSHSARVEPES